MDVVERLEWLDKEYLCPVSYTHLDVYKRQMYNKGIKARDIITKDAIMNALTVDMALGLSLIHI